jgi:hypothetical protein
MSSPSQVYSGGMNPLGSKAELMSCIAIPPSVAGAKAVGREGVQALPDTPNSHPAPKPDFKTVRR